MLQLGQQSHQSSKPAASKATSSVAHQLGSKDASADVTVGKITVDPTISVPSVPVTVTNHSSKRSNYIIELSLESADGKTQIDSSTVAVENLEPGRASKQTRSIPDDHQAARREVIEMGASRAGLP